MNLLTAFIRFYLKRTPANATALRRAIKLALPKSTRVAK